ncbi:MAG: glycosyltransferase family 4 protein [Actinomycetota bacterium]|nr:glycosyltransferase family 4 protein [Actinomycetota bacterium]
MKVAFQIDQLWFATPGGIGTYVRELGGVLFDAENVEVVPFHSSWHTPPKGRAWYPAVEVPGSIRTLYPSWDLFGRPALPAALADADVVHATNHAAVPPVRAGQRLVVTVHDLTFQRFPEAFTRRWRWLYRAGVRAAVRRADALLVPSRSTADDLISAGADPDRIHVIPLAASVATSPDPADALARLRVPVPFVLNVGTLEPRKNQVRLVRAYRRMVATTGLPHALVLAGPNGWGTDELFHELATDGPGRIVRTGSLPPEDLDALYRSADAFAYPSLYEGFGLPVVEAFARGVPTLTSNTSSLPEVAAGAALVVEPTDEASIASGLERLLTDRAFAEQLGRRGLERAATFSWEATARATIEVYRLVMGAA